MFTTSLNSDQNGQANGDNSEQPAGQVDADGFQKPRNRNRNRNRNKKNGENQENKQKQTSEKQLAEDLNSKGIGLNYFRL